jgi:NADH-quinone oxidoreductase subunit J
VDLILFYLFGAVAVVASLLVIGQRNPMYSVLLLIVSFGALSGLYILLDSPFAAVTQIIVYAGAIMVLFLFVVMLLNAPHEETVRRGLGVGPQRVGAVMAVAFALEVVWGLSRSASWTAVDRDTPEGVVSSVRDIGRVLFTEHAFAFEVTSVLILVAMVGAVVLARREP